jgi:S-adenosylmethionine decarboxylase
LANPYILVSSAALAALAVPTYRFGWLRRILNRKPKLASAPVISREDGWTLIHGDNAKAFNEWLGHDESGLPLMPEEEPSLGSHLLIELYGCKSSLLELESTVGEAMLEAARVSEATIVEKSFHEFKPYGVSGAVIIQESHYTIHTWPEHGYAAVDLFYCGGTIKVHRAVDILQERFKPERLKFLVVRRGLKSEVER